MEIKLNEETINSLFGLLAERMLWDHDTDLDKAINSLIQDDIDLYKKCKHLRQQRDDLRDYANRLIYYKYALKRHLKKIKEVD
jgi:hypothetical protein